MLLFSIIPVLFPVSNKKKSLIPLTSISTKNLPEIELNLDFNS